MALNRLQSSTKASNPAKLSLLNKQQILHTECPGYNSVGSELQVTYFDNSEADICTTCAFCLSSYMGQIAGEFQRQMHKRLMLLISVSKNAVTYQMAPICSKPRCPESNGTTQTHCNSPVTSPDPFWAHCAYGR